MRQDFARHAARGEQMKLTMSAPTKRRSVNVGRTMKAVRASPELRVRGSVAPAAYLAAASRTAAVLAMPLNQARDTLEKRHVSDGVQPPLHLLRLSDSGASLTYKTREAPQAAVQP